MEVTRCVALCCESIFDQRTNSRDLILSLWSLAEALELDWEEIRDDDSR